MEPPNGASNLHPLVKTEPSYSDYPNVGAGGPSSSAQFSFVYAEQFANYPPLQPVIGGVPTINVGTVASTGAIIGGQQQLQQQQLIQQQPSTANVAQLQHVAAPAAPVKQRHIYESPEARTRRLARNAERMRERRMNESDEDYRERLRKMAASNRERRNRENEVERAMRHIRDAARQRLRRAMETPDQRSTRLAKLAERSRQSRLNETPEQRALRQRKCLESNRLRYQRKMELQQQQTADGAAVATTTTTTVAAPAAKTPAAVVVANVENVQTKIDFGVNAVQPDGQQQAGTQNYNLSVYQSYQSAKPPTFPELPAHLAPANDTKYFVQMPSANYLLPGQSAQQVQYIYTVPAANPGAAVNPGQIHQQVHNIQTTLPPSTTAPPYVLQQSPIATDSFVRAPTPSLNYPTPAVTKGRPLKIFPANDYRSIAPTLHGEAQRQHQLNQMLDTQITHIINNPRSARGRPAKGPETDEQRAQRLRRMADQRAAQRDRETPEERAERLRDLAERARKRREQTLSAETADERRERLQRQAEYARQRQAGLSAQRRGK